MDGFVAGFFWVSRGGVLYIGLSGWQVSHCYSDRALTLSFWQCPYLVIPTERSDEGPQAWAQANPYRAFAISPMSLLFSAFAQLAIAQTGRSLNLKRTNS